MPTNHGIYRKLPTNYASGARITASEAMVFRYGIMQIFEALKVGPFLADASERQRAAQLEHHFREVCSRFVFALQHVNGLMQELVNTYEDETRRHETMSLHFQAECHADHILTYLNTLLDDVAIVTALATGYVSSDPIDNVGKLRSPKIRNDTSLVVVKPLLDDLDRPGSWWELAFQKGKGARQLLVHNQHLVGFQLSSSPGGPLEATAVVKSPFSQKTFACVDFFGLLNQVLCDLFDWLDRLEATLASYLSNKNNGWSPRKTCWSFLLPIGYPLGNTRFDPAYFPLPLCDGSDPLPWTVTVG